MIKRPTKKLAQNQEWVIVVSLSLLVTLLRLPSLEQPFHNDCGAIAYHARLIVRGEPLYSTHHPAHQMPAVYYTYALAFLLFGDSIWAVKFLLLLWAIVTVYLLYRLGALMMDKVTGALAAIIYSILASHVYMWGATAEIELFANLPRIAAILVLMRLMIRRAPAWKFVFVGMLSAAAFLFKAVYLSPLAMAGFMLLIQLWQTRATAGMWRANIMRALWIGAGFGAGLFPVVAYLGLLGLLPRFCLVFTIGQRYINFRSTASVGPQYWLLYPFLGLALNNAALLTFSLAGLVMMLISKLPKYHSQRSEESSTAFYVAVWYILSFVEAGISRGFFLHYYLLIVPPLALLAAWLLLKVYRDVKNQVRAANRFAVLFLTILLAIALFISVRQNFDYYYHYARYKLGLETYQDFLLNGWPAEGLHLVRVQELADYVKGHTSPIDYIYYWSGDVQIYYLADRRCPIDIIWPLYAEATGSYQRIFAPRTKYVIVGESNNIPRPDWLYTELAKKYTLETVIRDQEVYRRVD
jgi:hypothetical protein